MPISTTDAILDIVVIEPQTSAAVIRLGDGAGRFSFVSFGRTATNPTQVVTGDLDNDGRIDVATISKNGDVISLLYGDGTGRFRGTRGELFAGPAPRAIALGDLNADHRTDIAVANAMRRDASTSEQRAADGSPGATWTRPEHGRDSGSTAVSRSATSTATRFPIS